MNDSIHRVGLTVATLALIVTVGGYPSAARTGRGAE